MAPFDIAPRLADLERDLGFSDEALAFVLGINPRTVNRWHRNGTLPRDRARRQLEELWALRTRMLEMFSGAEQAQEWLSAQSMYLGWLTPAEVLRTGRIDRVRADLDALAAGIYQ